MSIFSAPDTTLPRRVSTTTPTDRVTPESKHIAQVGAQHDAGFILMRTREARITRIALAIVWLFLFCHIWRLIPTIYELIFENEDEPLWFTRMLGFSHTMIVFNSAVNLLLYIVL